MSYSRAHLAELGLTLWRERGAQWSEPEVEVSPAISPLRAEPASLAPAPAPTSTQESKSAAQQARGQQAKQAAAQLEADQQDQREAQAVRRGRVAQLDWPALQEYCQSQKRGHAKQAVFESGVRKARVMLIGDAPTLADEQAADLFVGDAGVLLDQMLHSIGLSRRENVYISTVCKWRCADNLQPRPEDVALDLPILQRQIQLVAPELIITVGGFSAHTLLGTTDPIARLRGKSLQYGASAIPLLVTYNPSYLLNSPQEKAKSWQDLKRARAILISTGLD